jgi:hypothetical protein
MGGNGKIAIEKLKTTKESKNTALNTPQIKTIKKNHEFRLRRPQPQHKEPEQVRCFFACR